MNFVFGKVMKAESLINLPGYVMKGKRRLISMKGLVVKLVA